ncbi:unnamed protein product [Linum trigynum]|uniref:Uncharacterized protein n=1 Tax=Linum trigynum TaxID=586398 RepID=A0AAV2EX16_9ROSI
MMLHFLAENKIRLAEVYVETEDVGQGGTSSGCDGSEISSHHHSYGDGVAEGCKWGGYSSNYERGSYVGSDVGDGVPWEE